MPKHIDAILSTVGLTAEDIQSLSSTADDAVFDTKPLIEKVKTNYRTQLQNDPAFFSELTLDKLPPEVKKKVESNSFGRAANIVKDKLLKGLGFTEADFADLPEEQKEKIETLIPIIAERYTKTKAGDKQLQQDLIAARKKIEENDGLEEKLKTKYETEANSKIAAAIFNAALIGELSSIPDLKVPAGDIAATASAILNGKYAFERVGDFGIELRQKANPTMKVLKDNSSHELTLGEAVKMIATERGWIAEKADPNKGKGVITVKPDGGGGNLKVVAPHIAEKINQKIANEK